MSRVLASRPLALAFGITLAALLCVLYVSASFIPLQAETVLTPPARLLATAVDGHYVRVVWLDTTESETGFRIERALDKTFTMSVVRFDVSSNITTYEDRSVEPLTTYYYRVGAYDGISESSFSSVSVAFTPDLVPISPSGLTALPYRPYNVTLNWVDNSYNETGFRLERASTSTFDQDVTVFTTSAGTHQAEDNGVSPGDYYYRVFAFNDGGESAPSSTASVSVAPASSTSPGLSGQATAEVALTGFRSPLVPLIVGIEGSVQRDGVVLNFDDGSGRLEIPRGTKLLTPDGKPLTSLEIKAPALLPQLLETASVITQAFEFGPPGSRFDPPITCRLKVDLSLLPSQNATAGLRAMAWNGNAWETLNGGSYDATSGLLTLKVSHFSTVAILAPKATQPPSLTVSNLIVYPQYSREGDSILIQIVAKNSGSTAMNYELTLMLNELVYETRYAAVEPAGASTENFRVDALKIGRYQVNVNGQQNFLVVQGETPIATTGPAATTSKVASSTPSTRPKPSSTARPAQTTTTTVGSLSPPTTGTSTPVEINYQGPSYSRVSPNWRLIAIIAGSMGALILVSLALFLIRR